VQLHPEPAVDAVYPLPSGAHLEHPEGPEEVFVLRLADPVRLRQAGRRNGFPLSYRDKSARARAGSSIAVAPGGRAEVLWANGTYIQLSGRGFLLVGSPSRGESLARIFEVERARISFEEQEQVELVGGALLYAGSGPFTLERVAADRVRVRNQSKAAGQLAIREEVITLDPGQAMDLPLMSNGSAPIEKLAAGETIEGPGFDLGLSGAAQTESGAGAVRVRALGDCEVRGLGQRLVLATGEEAAFYGLGGP
jgi:hypothetical protein